MSPILKHIADLQARITAKSPSSPIKPCLIGISKKQPLDRLQEAYAAGLRDFGGNYAQEMIAQKSALSRTDIRWHFVGGLQRNKVRMLLRAFLPGSFILHTLDSLRLAQELQKEMELIADLDREVSLECLVQIRPPDLPNSAQERNGITVDELPQLFSALPSMPRLRVVGLMILPRLGESLDVARESFAFLRRTRDQLSRTYRISLPHLSMGMSDDFEVALEEGATFVRIGQRLFGEREKKQ